MSTEKTINSIPKEQKIKDKALSLGFDAVGISKAEKLSHDKERLERWIEAGYQSSLGYMERNIEKREDPKLLVANTQAVISVILNYYPEEKQNKEQYYTLSKYAYGIDYHYVTKDKLKRLMDFISTDIFPQAKMRAFVDSAPVFDKSWAVKAGLGWIGKNTMLIHKKLGSFVFIGEIFIDHELKADTPFEANHCGTCSACIDSCPTQALIAPYQLDANRCISYHTIETKDSIPDDIVQKMSGEIYGCDICQDVCPWNRKAKAHHVKEFRLSDYLQSMTKEAWEELSRSDFKKHFKSSPIYRSGYKKLKQTIEQVKGR